MNRESGGCSRCSRRLWVKSTCWRHSRQRSRSQRRSSQDGPRSIERFSHARALLVGHGRVGVFCDPSPAEWGETLALIPGIVAATGDIEGAIEFCSSTSTARTPLVAAPHLAVFHRSQSSAVWFAHPRCSRSHRPPCATRHPRSSAQAGPAAAVSEDAPCRRDQTVGTASLPCIGGR